MVLVCMLPMVWMGVRAGFCDFLEVEVGVEGVLTPSPGTRGGASPQGAISKHQQAAACRSGQRLGLLVGVWAACRSSYPPPLLSYLARDTSIVVAMRFFFVRCILYLSLTAS